MEWSLIVLSRELPKKNSDKLCETQRELHRELHENVCKARMQWLKSGVFTSTLDLVREGTMYLALVYFILSGKVGIGDFMLYVGCVHNLAETFDSLMKTFAKLRRCSLEVNDYRTLNEFCEVQEKGEEIHSCEDYEIRFDRVSFQYPGTNRYALREVSITISSKEKLAVVGLNGAGKTTFVKLLMKLYKPTEGKIYLNGIDIQTINTESYYKLFAACGTGRENR